jgi:hypothetical protein
MRPGRNPRQSADDDEEEEWISESGEDDDEEDNEYDVEEDDDEEESVAEEDCSVEAESKYVSDGCVPEINEHDNISEGDGSEDSSDTDDKNVPFEEFASDNEKMDADRDKEEERMLQNAKEMETSNVDDEDECVSDSENEAENEPNASKPIEPTEQLPFVFGPLENHAGMIAWFSGRTLEQQMVLVQRARTLFHPSLKPGNKAILGTLLKLLVEHVETVFKFMGTLEHERSKYPALVAVSQSIPHLFDPITFLECFLIPIRELSHQFPEVITECARDRLKTFHESLKRRVPAVYLSPKPVVRIHEWVMVQIFLHLFSVTDFLNLITSPALMIVGEWLTALSQRFRHLPQSIGPQMHRALICDATTGLVLCGLIHQVLPLVILSSLTDGLCSLKWKQDDGCQRQLTSYTRSWTRSNPRR